MLAVGRLIYYKGFEYLVRAMNGVDGHLVVIGQGPLAGELRALADSTGVGDRVTLLGEVASVVPYYHAADVFVLPSIARSEAFGLVQLEAMAAGTPVVNTDLDSGVPYVSPDGVTGLTVPPRDADSLARAINRLLDDRQLARALGERGQMRVREHFTVDAMGRRTLETYRRVLHSG